MTLEINEKALQELAKAHLSRITQNFQHEVDQSLTNHERATAADHSG